MTPSELVEMESLPPPGEAGAVEQASDHPGPTRRTEPDLPPVGAAGAWAVLRRGLHESPELRAGLAWTVALAVVAAGGRLLVPVLLQQIVDRGLRGPHGFQGGFVLGATAIALALIAGVYVAARAAYRRLVAASEEALRALRVRLFAHIHELSIAEQTEQRRGTFVARVTADVDTLGLFLEWGAISWVVSAALMLGCLGVMLAYSWRLALVIVGVVLPVVLVLWRLQRGMLAAYDRVRTCVAGLLTEVSETLMGAAVVRAYGLQGRAHDRLHDAVGRYYRSQIHANAFTSTIFPVADLFGAAAIVATIVLGARLGPGWGLTLGSMVAFLFLVTLFLQPLAELSETFDQTQTAIAAWRKILGTLDLAVEVTEPAPGRRLHEGALPVRVEHLDFAYRDGEAVLHDVTVDLDPGVHAVVVGETGSGKTTLARLLCRLADPTNGRILVGGIDLREVSPGSRRRAIRLVPQDGFLFDTTVRENVRRGRDDAGDADVEQAFAALGLDDWVASLPQGLDTPVGERGESLSVGERQLVALARAQISRPGLLILDEATSAVDPRTERRLALALERLEAGRTTVTVAHRLSTAEHADVVLVFDRGRLVERGDHASLVAAGGTYASLYRSWLGNTRTGALA